MRIYSYHCGTGEYIGSDDARIDSLESKLQGQEVILLPAHATTISVPEAVEGMTRVFIGEEWCQVEDHRGIVMYDIANGHLNSMVALGPIPEGYTLTAPEPGMIRPKYEIGVWTETAIVFQGVEVACKADVDRITRQRIVDLGEEKAKTEKLIAGSAACPIWDAFLIDRAIIIQEGDDSISVNNLA